MKEIPINDWSYITVTGNDISFHRNTSFFEKIIYICLSIFVMLLLAFCLLIPITCFLELLKSPNILLTIIFCVFGSCSFLLFFMLYSFFVSSLSHHTRIEMDDGVMSYYSKRILSYSKQLDSADYVLIDFTYCAYRGYGIVIRLKRKYDFGHYFLWRTILGPIGMHDKNNAYKMSCTIENQIKEILPNLTIVNRCNERLN